MATKKNKSEIRPYTTPVLYQVSKDFKESAPVATFHDGKPIWLTVCEEFVGGKWEGFISIRSRKEGE